MDCIAKWFAPLSCYITGEVWKSVRQMWSTNNMFPINMNKASYELCQVHPLNMMAA